MPSTRVSQRIKKRTGNSAGTGQSLNASQSPPPTTQSSHHETGASTIDNLQLIFVPRDCARVKYGLTSGSNTNLQGVTQLWCDLAILWPTASVDEQVLGEIRSGSPHYFDESEVFAPIESSLDCHARLTDLNLSNPHAANEWENDQVKALVEALGRSELQSPKHLEKSKIMTPSQAKNWIKEHESKGNAWTLLDHSVAKSDYATKTWGGRDTDVGEQATTVPTMVWTYETKYLQSVETFHPKTTARVVPTVAIVPCGFAYVGYPQSASDQGDSMRTSQVWADVLFFWKTEDTEALGKIMPEISDSMKSRLIGRDVYGPSRRFGLSRLDSLSKEQQAEWQSDQISTFKAALSDTRPDRDGPMYETQVLSGTDATTLFKALSGTIPLSFDAMKLTMAENEGEWPPPPTDSDTSGTWLEPFMPVTVHKWRDVRGEGYVLRGPLSKLNKNTQVEDEGNSVG